MVSSCPTDACIITVGYVINHIHLNVMIRWLCRCARLLSAIALYVSLAQFLHHLLTALSLDPVAWSPPWLVLHHLVWSDACLLWLTVHILPLLLHDELYFSSNYNSFGQWCSLCAPLLPVYKAWTDRISSWLHSRRAFSENSTMSRLSPAHMIIWIMRTRK